MSNGRVYDPIHDVFQVQRPQESVPPVLSQSGGGSPEQVRVEREREQDDESTQSDELLQPVGYRGISSKPVLSTPTKKKGKEPSRYTRHLKKHDGEQFTRKDIQFAFLFDLLSDKRQIFKNTFQGTFSISPTAVAGGGGGATSSSSSSSSPSSSSASPSSSASSQQQEQERAEEDRKQRGGVGNTGLLNVTDVNYNARSFIGNEKLTFSQLYVLTIASSKKCSKILRDKLLFDHQVAFSTCVLSLLVNFGRLNTTVNFFPEMTSQLRTFHSIPCLQHQTRDPKSLQDTPRIKSILKTIPTGQEPLKLSLWYSSSERQFQVNLVNLLFTICDNPQIVNERLVFPYVAADTTLFEIFDSPKFLPTDRAAFFLWLAYIHLETRLTSTEIKQSLRMFGVDEKFPMRIATEEYDKDTEPELIFGEHQNQRRLRFLKKHPRKAVAEGQSQQPQANSQQQDPQQHMKGDRDNKYGDIEEDGVPLTASAHEEIEADSDMTTKANAKASTKGTKMRPRTRVKVIHQEAQQDASSGSHSEPVHHEQTQEEDPNTWAQEVDEMIEIESKFNVTPNLTHLEAQALLLKAQEIARKKRQELGLMKAFDEYEDVTLATVIGVRGKKRKKFNDGVLGYETDYMNYMNTAKKLFLKKLDEPLLKENFCL
ncbi:Ies1p Ecym_7297 [Eremothecium cymbalariae DBVPG|uniref:Ino eighty subunit 1 n=1 Tax=Eremothecium cymbalariae (strain CBS 270.75 / DBVPG 7215 / KCTC 17166 / NRRL Y-17582) TaxID=931890 RepID=G8JWC0_ERECY|nr:hypothetical protein Ecym_7297 [Eremothecium cymbalariae DBVPG\